MAIRYNEFEEDMIDLSKEYVVMVHDFLRELSPVRPFWQVPLNSEAALYRYMEIREKIIPWIVTAGAYMGYTSFGEILANLKDLWFGNKLVDSVPGTVIDQLPIELLQIVQAAPKDAAKYIRDMERLFEKKAADYQRLQAQPAVAAPPIAPLEAPPPGGIAEPPPIGTPVGTPSAA